MAERQGPLRHRIDESNALFEMHPGRAVFTQVEQCAPDRVMSLQAGRWLGLAPWQRMGLL
jgi:hypothetical protein